MDEIQQHLQEVKDQLPPHVSLVAVSKYHPVAAIQSAYDAGQRIFGESRVQELQAKEPVLPHDIEWHFIGHLQGNKIKYIAPYISLIHAVDSERLLEEIDRQGTRFAGERVQRGLTPQIPVLLQLHVAQEETKFGLTCDECRQLLASGHWRSLQHVTIAGIMCMASNTDDEAQIAREFDTAHSFFLEAKRDFFATDEGFRICSWGMSGDYPIAIAHGATHIRVGSYIFGERIYPQ